MNQHTCIKDDGGTPNRRCHACEEENKTQHYQTIVKFESYWIYTDEYGDRYKIIPTHIPHDPIVITPLEFK